MQPRRMSKGRKIFSSQMNFDLHEKEIALFRTIPLVNSFPPFSHRIQTDFLDKFLNVLRKSKLTGGSTTETLARSVQLNESSNQRDRQRSARNQIPICELGNDRTLPPIFKLSADSMDSIFEYLTLKDLHSFGQTCKLLQKVAGGYFKRNFKSADKFAGDKGIFTAYSDNKGVLNRRTQTSGFNQFINCILLDNAKIGPLRYIQSLSDEFTSINEIRLIGLSLDKVKYLRTFLSKIEILHIKRCLVRDDFHEIFLQFCPNLKRIEMQEYLMEISNKKQNSWLQRKYPRLEHFELTPEWSYKISELAGFIERNPKIRSFSTHSKCLWENRDDFMKTKAKLDKLEVRIFQRNINWSVMQKDCNLLNVLFKREFYKRLHLCIANVDQRCSDLLCTLNGLEVLCIRAFSECFSLPSLTTLKELAIFSGANLNEMVILAKSLVNLERFYLANATFDAILPFIRHSVHLNAIMFLPKNNNEIIDLFALNRERQQLTESRKVTVYVPDNIFLATKWTMQNEDFRLNAVEMKRSGAIEWDYHFKGVQK